MRIEPTSTPPVSSGVVSAASRAPSKSAEAAEPAEPAAPAAEAGAFALSGDLTALLAQVAQLPEVRADVIESVAAQLDAGVYLTPETAADAAKALLDSPDAR
jgi:hypothetical protein